MKTSKIVITGGPSTGKTAVIEQLEKDGFYCLHEVIRDMTTEEKTQGEKLEMVSNPIVSVPDPKAFNLKILHARIAQYRSALESPRNMVFFDRGIPDVLAYMDCFQQSYEAEFTLACESHRYDHIFLMPPWKEIHVTDEERFESFEEALQIHDCLANAYENLSYSVTHVPKGSIQERVQFILDQINTR
ncbi:MAG: ATP-binding protein [Aureibaculum sp.]